MKMSKSNLKDVSHYNQLIYSFTFTHGKIYDILRHILFDLDKNSQKKNRYI